MRRPEQPCKLNDRKVFWPEILILDGVSRAGKLLLGKFVSHFDRVEYFRYAHQLENIPVLWRLGALSNEAAVLFFRLNADLLVYEQTIGRNMNTRNEDATSIHKAPDSDRYLRRAASPRGPGSRRELEDGVRYPSFVTHEGLPNAALFFEAYPQMRIVNIQRHPVDLAHSWFRQDYSKKFGHDPLIFYPLMAGRNMSVPWWAMDWIEEYEAMAPADRDVAGLLALCEYEQESLRGLSDAQRARVHFICFDKIFTDPAETIRATSAFLNAKPLPGMQELLAAEGCGRHIPSADRAKKFEEIAANCSAKNTERLVRLSQDFEKRWNIPSSVCA